MLSDPERLIRHECAYYGFMATLRQTECAWYLGCPDVPDFQDANRALRLRDDGRGPDMVVRETLARLRFSRSVPVIDLDPVAREQGFEESILRAGMTPTEGDWLLMRYSSSGPPAPLSPPGFRVVNPMDERELQGWIDVTAADDDLEQADLWRAVAEREARSGYHLLLGLLEGEPASGCSLFSSEGWGRIESVVTLPPYRGRGLGAAVVARALRKSLEEGNSETFLFTEADGAGERLYLRLGFIPWEMNALKRFVGR
jgi:GNAT superfamily N-acetyltransferase